MLALRPQTNGTAYVQGEIHRRMKNMTMPAALQVLSLRHGTPKDLTALTQIASEPEDACSPMFFVIEACQWSLAESCCLVYKLSSSVGTEKKDILGRCSMLLVTGSVSGVSVVGAWTTGSWCARFAHAIVLHLVNRSSSVAAVAQ
eukprot:1421720-Amphidinium_carterae.2